LKQFICWLVILVQLAQIADVDSRILIVKHPSPDVEGLHGAIANILVNLAHIADDYP
jgi:hypothetical protein